MHSCFCSLIFDLHAYPKTRNSISCRHVSKYQVSDMFTLTDVPYRPCGHEKLTEAPSGTECSCLWHIAFWPISSPSCPTRISKFLSRYPEMDEKKKTCGKWVELKYIHNALLSIFIQNHCYACFVCVPPYNIIMCISIKIIWIYIYIYTYYQGSQWVLIQTSVFLLVTSTWVTQMG